MPLFGDFGYGSTEEELRRARRLAALQAGLSLLGGASSGKGLAALSPAFQTGLETYGGYLGQSYKVRQAEEEQAAEREREAQQARYTEALIEQMATNRSDRFREEEEGKAEKKLEAARHAEMLADLAPEDQKRLAPYIGHSKFMELYYEASAAPGETAEERHARELKEKEDYLKLGKRYETPATAKGPSAWDVEKEVRLRANTIIDDLPKTENAATGAKVTDWGQVPDRKEGESERAYGLRKAREEVEGFLGGARGGEVPGGGSPADQVMQALPPELQGNERLRAQVEAALASGASPAEVLRAIRSGSTVAPAAGRTPSTPAAGERFTPTASPLSGVTPLDTGRLSGSVSSGIEQIRRRKEAATAAESLKQDRERRMAEFRRLYGGG